MATTNTRKKRKVPHQTKGRRARKTETFTVNGHELTAEQFDEFGRRLVERCDASAADYAKQDHARQLALSDVLYNARASTKALKRFRELGVNLSRVGGVVAGARDYAFENGDPKLIAAYNSIIGHCADQVNAIAQELRAIHEGIAQEVTREVPNA